MLSSSVLIVVDLQVGVLEGCLSSEEVLKRTSVMVDEARSLGIPVIWVQDHGDFPKGSPEWALATPLQRHDDERLICKSYRDSFAATNLEDVLSELGATRLVLAGAQTDYCVRTTAQAAAVRGFDVTLVSDAHTTTDAEWDGIQISAAQIIAHTNMYFSGLRYPDATCSVETHDQVWT